MSSGDVVSGTFDSWKAFSWESVHSHFAGGGKVVPAGTRDSVETSHNS